MRRREVESIATQHLLMLYSILSTTFQLSSLHSWQPFDIYTHHHTRQLHWRFRLWLLPNSVLRRWLKEFSRIVGRTQTNTQRWYVDLSTKLSFKNAFIIVISMPIPVRSCLNKVSNTLTWNPYGWWCVPNKDRQAPPYSLLHYHLLVRSLKQRAPMFFSLCMQHMYAYVMP